MNKKWLFALLIVLPLSRGQRVFASPCDADSGSSSDDGGSSFDDDSDDDGGSSSIPVCRDSTKAVGYAQCQHNRFGRWDTKNRRPIRLYAGFVGGARALRGTRFKGSVEHDDGKYSLSYDPGDYAPNQTQRAGYGMFEGGAAAFVNRYLYVGGQVAFGGGSVASSPMTDSIRPNGLIRFELGATVGLSLPLGRYQLRTEAVTGLRSLGMSLTSTQGSCVKSDVAWNHSLMAMPKVAIERWMTPWVTVGLSAGTDLQSRDNLQFGLSITAHSRAFDGQR